MYIRLSRCPYSNLIPLVKSSRIFFLMKSIRSRNLIEERVSDRTYSKQILKVTEKSYSLLSVSTVSDEVEERINDFCMILTKRMRRLFSALALFKYHCTCLNKGIDNQDIWTESESRENIQKNFMSELYLYSDLLISSFRKSVHYMHFFIFVRNPHSNTALRNMRARYANVQTLPANFGSSRESLLKCRTVHRFVIDM